MKTPHRWIYFQLLSYRDEHLSDLNAISARRSFFGLSIYYGDLRTIGGKAILCRYSAHVEVRFDREDQKDRRFIYTLINFESQATIDADFLLRGFSNPWKK